MPLFTRRLRAALTVFFMFAFAAAPQEASAQDAISDFFRGIFGGGQHYRTQPRQPARPRQQRVRRMEPHQDRHAPGHWRAPTKRDSERRGKPEEKADLGENAVETRFRVAVIGDALALMLANGLDEAFESRPEIAFSHKGKENSGLTRNDFYDWPKAARELLAQPDKIDAVAIILGANARQPLTEGAQSFESLSPAWRERYAARIDALLAAFKEKGASIVWVGLPIMKAEQYSADMARLNDIYKARAEKAGASFVDIWEPFADERGQYSAFGPDVNGQNVKLRTADGIHFTEAGARKMAHFVEGELLRLLEARLPAAPPPNAETTKREPGAPEAAIVFPSPAGAPPTAAPTLPERPLIGPAQSLTGALPPADELARRGAAPVAGDAGAAAQAVANHLFVDGRDQPARPGRIDDFAWRGAGALRR
jgi:uncharacterized protein